MIQNDVAIIMQGSKGDIGNQGDRGQIGLTGPSGKKGLPGIKGQSDHKGFKGMTGEKGENVCEHIQEVQHTRSIIEISVSQRIP